MSDTQPAAAGHSEPPAPDAPASSGEPETWVPRRLRYADPRRDAPQIIEQAAVTSLPAPLIVLGDPGMGKSVLMRQLGVAPGNRFVRAGTFTRSRTPAQFAPAGGLLVIDGLDEVGAARPGDGLEAVLSQLSTLGHPPFILSSREADWRGAADRIRLEDDYGHAATVLHLVPFDEADARAFLTRAFPQIDTQQVLAHLAGIGLAEIYQNPLTLRMIGEVRAQTGTLPETRAALIDSACRLMLVEDNPRHHDADHAVRHEDELLLAAGAACAGLLLADRVSIHNGPHAQLRPDDLALAELCDWPFAATLPAALKTRLFQSDGENRMIPAHRVLAENLGARWIAALHAQGVSTRRLRALMTQAGGVPTSLRGLNAWTARFSPGLARYAIADDPYAVLRYGDAELLPLDQARMLLDALIALSRENPYFRSEDWGQHKAGGLIRVELSDQLLSVVTDARAHPHLATLLLDAIPGTPAAAALAPTLHSQLYDLKQGHHVRSSAAEALDSVDALGDLTLVARDLLALGDHDSARIAYECLVRARGGTVRAVGIVAVVLCYIGLSRCHLGRGQRRRHRQAYLADALWDGWDAARLASLLDELGEVARPLMRHADHWTRDMLADFVRSAAAQALALGARPNAERFWHWLGWLRGGEGDDKESRSAINAYLQQRLDLRRDLHALILLRDSAEAVRRAELQFYKAGLPALPDARDVLALLERAHARSAEPLDPALVLELTSVAPRPDGLDPQLLGRARALVGDDASALATLERWSKPPPDHAEQRRARQEARHAAKRQATYAAIRAQHVEMREAVRQGEGWALEQAADVYLGRYYEFDRDDAPPVRLTKLLGEALAREAMEGFIAALRRTDLPSAEQIAADEALGTTYKIAGPLICGIVEQLRREQPLRAFPLAALEAAHMAWRRAGESNVKGGIEIGPALEAEVLPDLAAGERFFRSSIEPQLAANSVHVRDLYKLKQEPRWQPLRAPLALDWLERFAPLPSSVEVDLLDLAIRDPASGRLSALLERHEATVHPDYEAMLPWLTADFVARFPQCEEAIHTAAARDPDFIWFMRARVGDEHRTASLPLSIAQRRLLVEAFAPVWPNTERPEGTTSSENNPWDATRFIDRMIYGIAGEPSEAATDALLALLEAPHSYGKTLRHALAQQRRLRRDHEFEPATPAKIAAVAAGGLPGSIEDMRAFFGDRMDQLRGKMHATNTDMWEAYWDGELPRHENFCRNRLIEHISRELPDAVRFELERQMSNQKRADIAAIHGAVGLPVEIKGQWHASLWEAPLDQLAARYARDWQAHGRGAYIVLWFGDVKDRQLPPHPRGEPPPQTPQALEAMLRADLPEPHRDLLDIYVIDASRGRPVPEARANGRTGSARAGNGTSKNNRASGSKGKEKAV